MQTADSGRERLPSISVVIPLYNAAETLAEQLAALAAQEYEGFWEVIIADNGSTDGGPDLARTRAGSLPSLRILDASDRRGVSHARNVGAGDARGEFIAICDADDVVAPGWLKAMGEAAKRFDLVGGVFDESTLNAPTTRSWRGASSKECLPVAMGFLPYAVGANCGVRRNVFRALGGWNERYVGGGDDIEFSWRAQLEGYRLGHQPEAVIHYRYRAGLQSLARQFYKYGLAGPRLYRDFRNRGAKRRSLLSSFRSWVWIVVHLPDVLHSVERRGVWVRSVATNWGRVRGSVRHRVVYL